MGRTILIGDIHGCLTEFEHLLGKLRLTYADHIVLLGDLVDKGPDSVGVVARARKLRADGHLVTLILGNHEDNHKKHRDQLKQGKDVTKRAGWEERQAITDSLSPLDIAFLDTAVPFCRIPGGLAVHGGVVPGRTILHSDTTALSRKEKEEFVKILRLRYVRFVDGRWKMISYGEELPGDRHWSDVYQGEHGHVFYGHDPTDDGNVRHSNFATGLDTGCVYGLSLTAAVVHADGRNRQYVAVPAERQWRRRCLDNEKSSS